MNKLSPPSFVRLAADAAQDAVVRAINRRPNLAHVDLSRVLEGLTFWKQYGPKSWDLAIRQDGMIVVEHSVGGEICLPCLGVLSLGATCSKMRKCPGFDSVLTGFNNRDEFAATLFMIQAAAICFREPTTREFCFGPEIDARGGRKRPDFSFVSPIGLITCECKDMHSIARVKNDSMLALFRELEVSLKGISLPDDLRAEVYYADRRPSHDMKRLASQIAAGLQELGKRRFLTPIKMNFECDKSIFICVSERKSAPTFKGAKAVGRLGMTDNSKSDAIRNAPVLLFSDKNDATAIGAHINEANQQLPKNGRSLIFIQPTHGPSTAVAVDRRIQLPEYANVLTFAFLKNTRWSFESSTASVPILRKVLPTMFVEQHTTQTRTVPRRKT